MDETPSRTNNGLANQLGMDDESGEESPHRISRTVKILGLVSFFTDVSSEMIYPLLPIFLSSVLGVGAAFIGVIEGIAEGTASVIKGFSGYISDRIEKRKALILAGYSLSTVVKPFFAATQAGWQVLILRFLDRVGKGIRTAPRDAMIAETSHEGVRGKAYGFHRGMDTLGAVVGPGLAFLLMWLLSDLGDASYRWVFLCAFVPGLIAVVLIVFVLKERTSPGPVVLPGLKLAGFGKGFKILILVNIVFTLGNSSDAFLLLKAQSAGMKVVLIPLLWLTFNAVYALVSMPAGMLSDRIGRKKTLLAGFGLYGLIYVGFAFADKLAFIWLLMAAYGIFYGITEGVMKAYVADLSPENLEGTAFGIYHSTDGICRLLASIIFGLMWQLSSPGIAFLFGAVLAIAAASLLGFLGVEH